MGYALTTAWDEGDGRIAAATAGGDPADPCHDDDSKPHSVSAQQGAVGGSQVRALQVRLVSGLGPRLALNLYPQAVSCIATFSMPADSASTLTLRRRLLCSATHCLLHVDTWQNTPTA